MHLCQQVLIKSERIRFYSWFFLLFRSFSVFRDRSLVHPRRSALLRQCIPCAGNNESERMKCDNRKQQPQHMTSSMRSDTEEERKKNNINCIALYGGRRARDRDVREKYRHSSIRRIFSFLRTVSAIDSIYVCSSCRPTSRTYCATQF